MPYSENATWKINSNNNTWRVMALLFRISLLCLPGIQVAQPSAEFCKDPRSWTLRKKSLYQGPTPNDKKQFRIHYLLNTYPALFFKVLSCQRNWFPITILQWCGFGFARIEAHHLNCTYSQSYTEITCLLTSCTTICHSNLEPWQQTQPVHATWELRFSKEGREGALG